MDFDSIYDIARHFEKLTNEIEYPKYVSPPLRKNYGNNADYGVALDEYEAVKAAHKEQAKQHRVKCNEVEQQFRAAALAYLDLSNHPKADKLYEIAYKEGHSGGFNDIAAALERMAELLT